MNKESCEKIYGKFLKEDENFYYFEGIGKFGVTVPKNVFWDTKTNSMKFRENKSV